MSLVRRHLVGVAAVVLALATGIVLGGGPLSHESLLPSGGQVAPAPRPADPGPSADDLAAEVAGLVSGARLDGRGVAVLATPGAPQSVVDDLVAGIEEADGAVVGRWRAGQALVSVQEKTLVDTLGSQLLEQLGAGEGAGDVSAHLRMGQLVGTALAAKGGAGATPDADVLTIRQSIDAARLLSTPDVDARRAPLLLLVLGRDLEDHVLADLVSGLASRAAGVVVAAPERQGDLAVLDGLDTVTTVDGVDGAAGRLAAVLALGRAAEEPGGSFGASGSDGLLPLR